MMGRLKGLEGGSRAHTEMNAKKLLISEVRKKAHKLKEEKSFQRREMKNKRLVAPRLFVQQGCRIF